MAGLTGSNLNPSWKLISGTLNGENQPSPGSPIAANGIPGAIVSVYGGFLGTKGRYDADDALKLSNTTIGTLYGGTYQYVRISPSATQANLQRGRLVFWDLTVADDLYQVTNDETQNGGAPIFAGVLLNAPTAGNYAIIQVEGKATVQCRATVSAATRNIIWSNAGAGVDNATVDGLANATAMTGANAYPGLLGIGEQVAANASLILVDLRALALRQ